MIVIHPYNHFSFFIVIDVQDCDSKGFELTCISKFAIPNCSSLFKSLSRRW